MKWIPITLFFWLPLLSYGQSHKFDHVDVNDSRIKRPVLKLNLGSIISVDEALLPVGVEYRWGRRISTSAEVGIPLFFNTFSYKNSEGAQKDMSFDIRYGFDFRCYFELESENVLFLSLTSSARQQKYKVTDGEYYGVRYYYEFKSVDINKWTYTINFMSGTQVNITRKLFFEIQSGLGIEYITLGRSNFIGQKVVGYYNSYEGHPSPIPWGKGVDRLTDNSFMINIPVAIRFCYTL